MSLPDASVLGKANPLPAMYLKLSPEAMDAILSTHGKNVTFKMKGQSGNSSPSRMELQVGRDAFPLTNLAEGQHIDLYKKSKTGFDCIGNVCHRASVMKPGQQSRLANTTPITNTNISSSSTKEAKNRTSTPPLAIQHKQQQLHENGVRSTPSSPLINNNNKKLSPPSSSAAATFTKPLSQQPSTSEPVRVVRLLALGAATATTLTKRTGLPTSTLEPILKEYAKQRGDGTFVLADGTWKEVKLHEWFQSHDRQQVAKEANMAFDRLKLPKDHPARRMNSGTSPKRKPPSTTTTAAATATTTNGNTPTSPPKQKSKSPIPTSGAVKRKAASSSNSTVAPAGKRQSLGNGTAKPIAYNESEDVFELAARFRKTYSEYERLYKILSAEQARSKDDVAKLMSMHQELESWKKKIWASNPGQPKQSV